MTDVRWPVAGVRRMARTAALQALFEIDLTGHLLDDVLRRRFEEADFPTEGQEFAAALVRGVVVHLNEIDDVIRKAAPAWPLDQMARIDKNILRLAIFEILFDRRTPLKVAINEAVELAKLFGGDNSARFVNGVLGWVSAHAAR